MTPLHRLTDLLALTLLMLLTISPAGCVEPGLGDVPFYCNPGSPQCPEGYRCVADRCVREGVDPTDGGSGLDLWPIQGDTQQHDQEPPPNPVKWDLGSPPLDTSSPGPDGEPPPTTCQTDSDCTSDPQNPCCCLGVCEIVCLFTLCF
jgi:hypothetical protein